MRRGIAWCSGIVALLLAPCACFLPSPPSASLVARAAAASDRDAAAAARGRGAAPTGVAGADDERSAMLSAVAADLVGSNVGLGLAAVVLSLDAAGLAPVGLSLSVACAAPLLAWLAERAWSRLAAVRADAVRVADAGAKGRGLFARRAIARETFLGKYSGESLSLDALVDRYDLLGERKAPCEYTWRVHADWYVDAREPRAGNVLRFVNHEARGEAGHNVDVRIFALSGVYYFANRDIAPGEELCCDYGGRYWKDREDLRL